MEKKYLAMIGSRIKGKKTRIPVSELADKFPGTFEDLKRAGLKDVEPGQRLEIPLSKGDIQ